MVVQHAESRRSAIALATVNFPTAGGPYKKMSRGGRSRAVIAARA